MVKLTLVPCVIASTTLVLFRCALNITIAEADSSSVRREWMCLSKVRLARAEFQRFRFGIC